ncbi:unnamed protein product, partial [Mesorhabditis belari]|uniref:Uncharacterized protein n=1 Tax=Mesorhabditis belari TaxID=2138241 RepID=A0AAF3E9Z9_9BILA
MNANLQRLFFFFFLIHLCLSCMVPPCPWRPYRRHRLTKKEIMNNQLTELPGSIEPVEYECSGENELSCGENCCDTRLQVCLYGRCLNRNRLRFLKF